MTRTGTWLLAFLIVATAAQAEEARREHPDAVGEPSVYKIVDGRELKLYLSKPDGWKPGDKRPAIVLFHGGGWQGGAPSRLNPQALYFSRRGMVSVLVEYRLSRRGAGEAPTNACMDAKSAMRWVRGHAAELGIDPDRIAAGGGSAGGHLAAFVSMVEGMDDPKDDTTCSPKANALILFNPVYNNGPGNYGYERVGEKYRAYSPAHNIRADAPPTLVLFGTKDRFVPVKVAEAFRDEMRKNGVRSELVLYEGQPHGFFNEGPWTQRTLDEADKFLVSLGWLPARTEKRE